MDADKRDNILKKVKACLDLSKGTTFDGESATALKMAKKLLAEHNLSMAEVEAFSSLDDIQTIRIDSHSVYMKWDNMLINAVCVMFNVKVFLSIQKNRKQNMRFAVFTGYKDDVVVASRVYVMLRDTVRNMGFRYTKDFSARNTYMYGIAVEIVNRAMEEIEFTKEEEQVKYGALVLRKKDNIDEWLQDKFELKKGGKAKPKEVDVNGLRHYVTGIRDGRSVPLGNKKEVEG